MDLSLSALRSGFARLGRHLRRGALAYTVLLMALLLTLVAYYYVRQNAEAQTRARFEDTTQATQEAIERRTKAYLDAMFGARALFYASDPATRKEWNDYVEGIQPGNRFKGLQALSYAERVTPGEREAFARRARDEGLTEMKPDLAPGGERPVYFPIIYTGPLDEANRSRLDYDLYADPEHRVAMDLARDAGSPRATKMVYVLTEAPPDSSADLALREGFVVYLPVYQEGEPRETVAERRRALRGFIVGSFVIDDLLGGIFKGSFNPSIDFEVYDGKSLHSSPLLYDRDGIKRAGESGANDSLFSKESNIEVAGRQWSLYFATLPEFEREAESKLPTFVLVSGLCISLLLFGVTWMLVRSRTRAERASKNLQAANRDLEAANRELEAFSYSVSHDLRAPLRSIEGFSQILLEDYAKVLDQQASSHLKRVRAASQHMASLIDDLLELSRVTRSSLKRQRVDLSALARQIASELNNNGEVELEIEEGLVAQGDARLLAIALENLLSNAFKFTSTKNYKAQEEAGSKARKIEFGAIPLQKQRAQSRDQNKEAGGERGSELLAYYVKDNGVGFDMAYAGKLFGPFQRLHRSEEFEGTGIGLATVARIVQRHGGRVWAEGKIGEGATFFFTLGK